MFQDQYLKNYKNMDRPKSPNQAIQNLAFKIKNPDRLTDESVRNEVEYFSWKAQKEKSKYQLSQNDFNYLFNWYANIVMKDSNKKYENHPVIETVKSYFMRDGEFNAAGVVINKASLDKGILIWGPIGVGKSMLFNIIHLMGKELAIKRNCHELWFRSVTAKRLVNRSMQAIEAKKNYDTRISFDIKHYYSGALYIDDVGFEDKLFNKTELIADILFERHRRNARTFITTNNSPLQLMERYGDRIGDRLPEMFNIIKWDGESLREE